MAGRTAKVQRGGEGLNRLKSAIKYAMKRQWKFFTSVLLIAVAIFITDIEVPAEWKAITIVITIALLISLNPADIFWLLAKRSRSMVSGAMIACLLLYFAKVKTAPKAISAIIIVAFATVMILKNNRTWRTQGEIMNTSDVQRILGKLTSDTDSTKSDHELAEALNAWENGGDRKCRAILRQRGGGQEIPEKELIEVAFPPYILGRLEGVADVMAERSKADSLQRKLAISSISIVDASHGTEAREAERMADEINELRIENDNLKGQIYAYAKKAEAMQHKYDEALEVITQLEERATVQELDEQTDTADQTEPVDKVEVADEAGHLRVLAESGLSMRGIAQELGKSVGTVQALLKKYGIKTKAMLESESKSVHKEDLQA